MPTTILRRVAAGALLSVAWLSNSSVRAQLTVEPQSVSVTVEQYETAARTVTLTNAGSQALAFCVSFDRPLQRAKGESRLAESAAGGAPCGDYGEVLHYFDEEDFGAGWGPTTITMTPDGRLFTNESGGLNRTFEFTPDLTLVRSFEHPHVAELTPFNGTWGVGYDAENGTLWWMNSERTGGSGSQTRRILLLEGNLDGEETGRRVEIVPPETPLAEFGAGGLSYDPATDLFYFLGISDIDNSATRALWAVDREGTLAEGYPVRPEPYPPPALHGSPDAHGGAEGGPEGVRIEYAAYPTASAPGYDRVVVVDRWGNAQDEELETPMPAVLFEDGGYGVRGNPLRSRIDPNGVMYVTFTSFDHTGILGVRPHPLPPSWLVVDSDEGPEAAWDGTLAPGERREIILTFRAGAREVGTYTSSLQVFEAETGEAVAVPLVLTVTEGTDAEDGPEREASSLAVYPNPLRGTAIISFVLDAAADVRLAVYDVLGREVAMLHAGPLPAGAHRFTLDSAGLPAGVYVVRATGDTFSAARRVTLVR